MAAGITDRDSIDVGIDLTSADGTPSRPPRGVVGNSVWAGVGELGRVGTQAALLVVVARALGPDGFGRFAATTTLLQLIAPLIWFGAYSVLIQRVATGAASLSQACSTALTTVVVFGPWGGVLLALLVRPILLEGVAFTDFLVLAGAELIYMGVIETLAVTGWAAEQLVQSAAVRWAAGLCRLAGAGVFLLLQGRGQEAELYSVYLLSTAGAAVVCTLLVRRWYGLHLRPSLPDVGQLKLGTSFAVGGAAFMLQDNIDKPLVLRLAGPDAAGTYTAGYRVVIVALMPIRALLMASFAQFFRVGTRGLRHSSELARRRLLPAAAYSIAAAVVLLASADLVARVFGEGFEETAEVVRWLALLPLIRSCYVFVGDALTGAGLQPQRTRLTVCATALNVILNLILIPEHSWRGAVIATLVSEVVLGIALWSLLAWRLRWGRTARSAA
jgi:O-antigen/teichoic acid export membrane protein